MRAEPAVALQEYEVLKKVEMQAKRNKVFLEVRTTQNQKCTAGIGCFAKAAPGTPFIKKKEIHRRMVCMGCGERRPVDEIPKLVCTWLSTDSWMELGFGFRSSTV